MLEYSFVFIVAILFCSLFNLIRRRLKKKKIDKQAWTHSFWYEDMHFVIIGNKEGVDFFVNGENILFSHGLSNIAGWERALSKEEILHLYNAGQGVPCLGGGK